MIQINGTIKLGRSIDAATRKAIVEMVRASRAEDGCLDYAFAGDLADPDTLILFERWRDRAALDAHGKSEHRAYHAWMARYFGSSASRCASSVFARQK